ncbi:hypothetical protein Jiend_20730 [Micromonospora endophytica]|nr:hypothetical protein Jiend_20730 [Micromonospora endophytica]
MTNPNPEPDSSAAGPAGTGSPDKAPASEEQATETAIGNTERAEAATTPSAAQEPRPTLGRLFLENLWAANTFTVTLLSLVLAMIVGAVLMIVSDPDVLATYAYITARPSDAINGSWTLVSEAYANLFKGSVFDPGATTLNAALSPISETLTYTAPLVFTGLSVALAFRGGLFNIGAQGRPPWVSSWPPWPVSCCRCHPACTCWSRSWPGRSAGPSGDSSPASSRPAPARTK